MVEYLKKILSYLLSFTKYILPILLLLVMWIFFKDDFLPKQKTYGHIWVDSPEIYTRERLVNDRFLQDSWLQNFLKNEKYKEKMSLSKQDLNTQMGNKTNEKSNTDNKDLLEELSKINASSEGRLIDQLDYRDRIRNLIIENQLDDRHDLNGNSLYRLKFDTTILPGNRTSAHAWIEIKLKSFYTLDSKECNFSKKDLKKWRKIYKKWLTNLQSRLNRTHTELIDSYANNEFKDSDYKDFISFIEIMNDIKVKNISSIKKECNLTRPSNDSQYSIDHTKYKDCFNSIAIYYQDKYQDKKKSAKQLASNISISGQYGNENVNFLKQSDYKDQKKQSESNISISGQYGNEPEETKFNIIERNLNVFMHINTLKLVFGIKMTAEDMKKMVTPRTTLDLPQLENLSKISIFSPKLSNRNQNIYKVTEKFDTFTAHENNYTKEERFTPIPSDINKTFENNSSLYMEKEEARLLSSISDELTASDLKIPIKPFVKLEKTLNKNYSIGIESGLMRFIMNALQHTKTYTYAITPKMRANNQIFSSNRTQSFDIYSSLLNTLLSHERRSNMQTLNREGTTVGYGKAGDEDDEAVFGWVIGPQLELALAESSMMVHTPQQLSLSALLAVPSWWDKGILEVTTKWLDEEGTAQKDKKTIEYEIDFPLDFKQLETKILDQIHLGPELYDAAQEPISLIACQPGTILIRGKRLWRSTMVTLGTQSADQILVLPNMKGIIAKFNNIVNPINIAEEKKWKDSNDTAVNIKRRVRVWTSQGTISLPQLAEIGVYQECHQHRIKDINNTVKGNHE